MNEQLNDYLRAVSLRRNLEHEYSILDSNVQLLNHNCYENLRLAVADLVNYGVAINGWTNQHHSLYLLEASFQFDQEKFHFLTSVSKYLAGEFDACVLEEAYDKHHESILLDKESAAKYVRITLRVVEELVNRQSSDFKKILGITGNCDLFSSHHQEAIKAFLKAEVKDAINTCKHFEEILNTNFLVNDRKIAMTEMLDQVDQAANAY